MAKLNFCKTARLISECSAENPEQCLFYEQAKYHGRCTYQTIDLGDGDYNCACVKARENSKEIEDELTLEMEEGKLPL